MIHRFLFSAPIVLIPLITFGWSVTTFSSYTAIVSTYCWLLCIAAIIVAQVYRFRHLYSPVERQQTKWVLFFGCIALMVQVILYSLNLITALFNPGSLFSLFYFPTIKLFLTLFGFSLLFSMLRYRLWDIDRIINRTLVYGLLTGVLALVYFGLVIILQFLLRGLTGQVSNSPLVIVGSTLAIAALFQPVRRSIQSVIDRRFYRRKYDAVKTVEAFSATLRNEVDLNQLNKQLIAVVEETMQPSHVSLWLRPTASDSERSGDLEQHSSCSLSVENKVSWHAAAFGAMFCRLRRRDRCFSHRFLALFAE